MIEVFVSRGRVTLSAHRKELEEFMEKLSDKVKLSVELKSLCG